MGLNDSSLQKLCLTVLHKCFLVFNLCVSRFIYSVYSRSDPEFTWWR